MLYLVDILMIEHVSIRQISKCASQNPIELDLVAFQRYLEECHIEIEEKIVFPSIESAGADKADLKATINRIKADHRLIGKLAANLIQWKSQENIGLFQQRFPLYFKLLTEHNSSEDQLVFPLWNKFDPKILKSDAKEAANIIESFGVKEYLAVTGLSHEAYVSFFEH